ncbi:hypothetical protein FACS1894130_05690 [Spirochaetia bacterium]|nr:hypothetical protein FACS1894130_05690 [Spirochaetia bacterium]
MYAVKWSRLDNAAKIFPPSTSKTDTKVFRFSCELYAAVDAETLQYALNTALEQFPFYRMIIRRGFFWYYFEKSDIQPVVREEYKPPCAPLYDVNRKNLLFEITWYRKRINLEIYHALSDGVGALQFLRTIVYYYLLRKHAGEIDENTRMDDNNASDEQRSRDAFDTYYARDKGKAHKLPKGASDTNVSGAYHVRGERFPESRLGVIEGHVSAAAVLQKAHEYHATLSEFLTTVLFCSLSEGMTIRDRERPVTITIPVDLRKYFSTPSTRNFFSVINVTHDFSAAGSSNQGSFDAVLTGVKAAFKALLKPEKLHDRLIQLLSLEHAFAIKVVPLFFKVPVLRNAAWKAEKEQSAGLSNIGKITMPEAMVPYIRLFNIFSSTRGPHICLCSFEDTLVISFASPLVSSDVQRSFFRTLSNCALEVEIVSNTADLGV